MQIRRAAPPRRAKILAGTLACLSVAGPAAAHAILVASTPAPLAHVPAGPLAVTLRYNSRIDAGRSKLTLVGADGASTRLTLAPGASADVMTTQVSATPGAWRLRWQVLAVDGHITRGDVPFTVDPR